MKAGLMLAVNPKAKREENDFYATDPFAIDIVLPTLEKIGLNKNIWECACGKGHLAKRLKDNGYNVYASDLIDRGYGEVKDFLKTKEKFNGDILTNPPFRFAEDFVKKGFEVLSERAGQGRPKGTTGAYKENPKTLQVAFKLTAEEKAQLEERAAKEGISVSKYLHLLAFGE